MRLMKIAIIGMGLIGGSLGRAFVKYTDNTVYGFDIREEALDEADKLCAISGRLTEDNIGDMDVAIVALNEADTVRQLDALCPKLKDGALVMDVCGNKRRIVAHMRELMAAFGKLNFCGFHPMAGREFSGIAHSTPTLFKGAYAILVPVSRGAEDLAAQLLLPLGFKDVEACSAQKHDTLISYTSQLAHVVSGCYASDPLSAQHAGYSAGSFNDLTRVARLDADMWTELFLNNADNLVSRIDGMIDRLEQYKVAIESGDAKTLNALLRQSTNRKLEADKAARERSDDRG